MMEKIISREHDFSAKLRQKSVLNELKRYILWLRSLETNQADAKPPCFSPISINLDLTSACNFSCQHCVDSKIINTGDYLHWGDIKKTIDVLHSKGLLSIILLGGGEPTLHKDFEEIVKYIKKKSLQVGIVTNGTRLDKIANATNLLEEKDWVRISLDASREDTFQALHRPRVKITLKQILEEAKKFKKNNPMVSMGYSFVIIWEGMIIDGNRLNANIEEIVGAVGEGIKYSFDYISFKPCLIRLPVSGKESLLYNVNRDREEEIAKKIEGSLQEAKSIANDKIKILESVNLQAMLTGKIDGIKKQPKKCHMQFFRTVVTPSGIFHCPAFRGIEKACIAEYNGCTTEIKFNEMWKNLKRSLSSFVAEEECRDIGCFYHQVNWWLDDFINSEKDVNKIKEEKDDNFFF